MLRYQNHNNNYFTQENEILEKAQEPHCPYCGAKMTHTAPLLHKEKTSRLLFRRCKFFCRMCLAAAPLVDGSFDSDEECLAAAREAALKRIT